MDYRIKRVNTATQRVERLTRKRADAARRAMYGVCYEVLKGLGKLDTKKAREVRDTINAWRPSCGLLVQIGQYDIWLTLPYPDGLPANIRGKRIRAACRRAEKWTDI